jgi:flagellar hook assembly protein FlgD
VYNVAGQLVRTLVDGTVEAGVVHEATWRGLNNNGSSVASGVYFYRLAAGDFVQTKKMVLLE